MCWATKKRDGHTRTKTQLLKKRTNVVEEQRDSHESLERMECEALRKVIHPSRGRLVAWDGGRLGCRLRSKGWNFCDCREGV